MSIDGELILPLDVRIVPVSALAPGIRAKFEASEDDFTISRERMRAHSSIIDKDTAELLEIFRVPMRIVDAIVEYAGKRGLDPESTLEQAYPVLNRLYRGRLLVPPQSDAARRIEGALEVGGVVAGFRLIRCIQVLDDNEVFLARDAGGRFAALKFYRVPSEDAIRMLEREADVLNKVGPRRAPRVLELLRLDRGAGLVTEWVAGSDALCAADLLRGQRDLCTERRLLELCTEVVAAFADVHELGLVHGDVHPRNVLVERSGSVRLIDFGLAREIESPNTQDHRGGIPFYFDPEFAQSLRGLSPVRVSCAAEQYSVAALLYQIWTGVHYLDWNLERDALLRQIVEDLPVPFKERGVPERRELEAVLRRALHKSPESRYPDTRSLAVALSSSRVEAELRDEGAIAAYRQQGRNEELLARLLARFRVGGELLPNGLLRAPRASINYGAGGIAYTLLRIAQQRDDPGLLSLADLWSQRSYALADADDGFYNLELEIERNTVGERSLFHSPAGLHCVRALVSAVQGDVSSCNSALRAFIEYSRGPNECLDQPFTLDAVLGKGSLLLGCAELIEAIPDISGFELEAVHLRGEELARELCAFLELEAIASSERLAVLGIAHGWAGLVFALLRWASANGLSAGRPVRGKLEELALLGEPDGTGVHWPVRRGGSTFVQGWCNGSAGYAMLYALAHRVLGEGNLADLSERAAISALNGQVAPRTLCCGQAGIGYASLAAYRITGSQQWLQRARSCAQRAAADGSPYFLEDALYQGAVGVALLTEELRTPETAAMPLFEPVR